MKGLFIVFEGPNGVGKTTVMESVCAAIEHRLIPVVRTKEPTTSDLGNFIRKHQDVYTTEVLACLVTANRYEHLDRIVRPSIDKGRVIVSDRYFPSSLVYQMMDGLDFSFIKSLNDRILIPDLTIFLTADEKILSARLKQRIQLTRFEKDQKKEVQRYEDAQSYIEKMGWNTLSLNSGEQNVHELTDAIVNAIVAIYKATPRNV
ncbi:dTMP kinase [Chryseolinea sp. H1M3-3]|uniref:dTMP kinase n=1 Tax=Chryseolinea sp. H1M3-3 TaxID=3034144 RepID=UPI0023EB8A66|nr:dTMP kinase [Chryseolinea sp. H1M3-3]